MKVNKKIISLVIFFVIVLLLLGSGVILKNIFLGQIKKKVQSSFEYARLHLSFFPPALVLEDVRTRSLSPFFSAEKIAMKISYKSLLTKQKPFNVLIEHPILKLYTPSAEEEEGEKREFNLSFPFLVEEGEVKEGEFYFWGKEVSFQSMGINARFLQKRNAFSLRVEAEDNIFSSGSARPQLKGKVSFSVESRGKKINVKRLKIDGSDFSLKAEGSLVNPLNPELNLETSFKAKAPLIVELLHLPFEWEGEAEGKGTLTRSDERIAFKGEFSSNNLFLNRVFMGNVNGKIDFDEKAGQTVEFNMQKGALPREFVRIHFAEKKVEGIVRGVYLDPITKFLSLPWPVASPIWGNFSIDKGKLEADVEFKDEYFRVEPDQFPFRGIVKFNWDLKKEISFSSQSLSTGFAHLEVKGEVEVGKDVDIIIQGEVKDVKQARRFTSIILAKNFNFPEIRGKGKANLRIFGDYYYPQVQANFSLSPGGFDKFEVNSVEGEAEIIKGNFSGRFRIEDPFMKGKIGLFSNQEGLMADIRLDRGFVERIFPALDINFPLRGEASGNFEIREKNKDIHLKGAFSSSLMNFVTQDLKEVSGKLELQGETLSLSELQFRLHEGIVRGNTSIGLSSQEFDIDIQGESIDLSSLYAEVKGNLGFSLKGKGVFGRDWALGPFAIKGLHYSPLQKTEARGQAKFGYSEGKLSLELNGNFLPGENEFNVSFSIPIREDVFSVDIRGSFSTLDLLLPWKGAEGRVDYLGEIRGQKDSPQVKGAIDFKGSVFPLPGFAHAFRDYSGLMFVENSLVSFRSLQAKLGGGDVQGSGELKLGKGGIEIINAKMEGKNLLLSLLERTRALADGSLNLIKDSERFVLEGEFLIQKLSWRREIDEKFIFSSRPYYQDQKGPGFFDDLTLNIRMKADDNAWMENSLGRIRGRFDLTVTGSVNAPVVMGNIEALGGDVYFQDRRFKILIGRLSFFNPLTTEPYLSFKGETYVKDYRVTFSLDGMIDRLNPEFSSSPPLPPEDVLALLALGESFRRTYSYDASTRLSTASLVSFQLLEDAKKRAEKLFSIDRFRIDPFLMGSSAEIGARLTVGKKISKNFFILYSTNLSTQKEEIARLEWQLTDELSIVGIRDEKGRISFDVKIHKRF